MPARAGRETVNHRVPAGSTSHRVSPDSTLTSSADKGRAREGFFRIESAILRIAD
ncbi:hypothetical protein [Halorussus caseinilyticus]|uniref:Uncharacterized protein n=1 Tax=Halorussus caseinilyticus TaxID=3034025 RepID=A0ABD5WNS5_9EURY|nr:hypothetical protein [Halorussus sp. DT72]